MIYTYLVRGPGDRGIITTQPTAPSVNVDKRERWNSAARAWESAWCHCATREALTAWALADERDDELTQAGEQALDRAEAEEVDRVVQCG